MNQVYQIVCDKLIAKMDQGKIPWKPSFQFAGGNGSPKNLVSGKPYRGINTVLLWASGYDNPYFLTIKQCNELGGTVRAGSKSEMVTFFKTWEHEDKNGNIEHLPVLRYYNVFNADQCEGINSERLEHYQKALAETLGATEFAEDFDRAESIFVSMPNRPTVIEHASARAFYRPATDEVNLPLRAQFDKASGFYSVAFHELIHSTGHLTRLNRNFKDAHAIKFGGEMYSREELVAEIGAAFVCADAGILHHEIENQAAYLQGWIKFLKDDPQAIVVAAGAAQKAADYLLGTNVPALATSLQGDMFAGLAGA